MTYAVLTGDIINSTSLGEDSEAVLQNIKMVLNELKDLAKSQKRWLLSLGSFVVILSKQYSLYREEP